MPAGACSVSLSLLIMSGMSWPTIGSVSGLAHRTTSLIASNACACSRVPSPWRAACDAPPPADRQIAAACTGVAAALHVVLASDDHESEPVQNLQLQSTVQGCTVSSRAWMMSLK